MNFKDRAFCLREAAILDATTETLAQRGFDQLTMDDIAVRVGISKPSLYKHFKSREDLVAATMTRLLHRAQDTLNALQPDLSAYQQLTALLTWAIDVRLAGGLPFLPSTNANIRDMLMRNADYMSAITLLNLRIMQLVQQAKAAGDLNPELPDTVILFSYYARTCDPTVEFLQTFSDLSPENIRQHMLDVCFQGLSGIRKD
ncbi:MAG: TetR/AcrR family transcriptional regulator [Pseudomonadales bacterium]|nr:TetR/AcrR family transcriptional regulator [Pseudomonadales bacterium]